MNGLAWERWHVEGCSRFGFYQEGVVPAAGVLGVDPWQCGPSLADMDLEGPPEAVKRRVLGLR